MMNNSASVDVTFIVWWMVLMTGELYMCTWAIEVTTWFLMLASDMTMTVLGSFDALKIILLSLQRCDFQISTLFLSDG